MVPTAPAQITQCWLKVLLEQCLRLRFGLCLLLDPLLNLTMDCCDPASLKALVANYSGMDYDFGLLQFCLLPDPSLYTLLPGHGLWTVLYLLPTLVLLLLSPGYSGAQ